MRVAVFSTKPYDERLLTKAAKEIAQELTFFEAIAHDTIANITAFSEGRDSGNEL